MKSLVSLAEDLLSMAIQQIGVKSYSKYYLSQNLFAGESDFSIRCESDLSQVKSIRQAEVLFVKSEFLTASFELLNRNATRKIVLVGDSDIDWPTPPHPRPGAVKGLFVQNLLSGHTDRSRILPIGVEGRNYGRNGLPHLFGRPHLLAPKLNRMMIGPFANTHPERKDLIEARFLDKRLHKSEVKRISSLGQAVKSSTSSHVLCPRGNGMDTHRFWESIYRGSRPVVLNSQWANSLRSEVGNLFDVIDSFEESELLKVLETRTVNSRFEFARTTWPYWKKQIREALLS